MADKDGLIQGDIEKTILQLRDVVTIVELEHKQFKRALGLLWRLCHKADENDGAPKAGLPPITKFNMPSTSPVEPPREERTCKTCRCGEPYIDWESDYCNNCINNDLHNVDPTSFLAFQQSMCL